MTGHQSERNTMLVLSLVTAVAAVFLITALVLGSPPTVPH
jgi:hypothetical protein